MLAIYPSLRAVFLTTTFAFLHIGLLVETLFPGFVAVLWKGEGICGFLARSLSIAVSGITFFIVYLALTFRVDDIVRTKAQRDRMLRRHPPLRARRAFTEGWRYATRLQVPEPRNVATYDAFLRQIGRTLEDDHCAICMSTFAEVVKDHEADTKNRDLYSAFVKLDCDHVYCTQWSVLVLYSWRTPRSRWFISSFIDWLCNGVRCAIMA